MSRINDIWQRKPAGLVLGLDFSGERLTSPTGHSGTLVGGATVAAGTRYLAVDGVDDELRFDDAPEFSFTSGGGVDLPFSVGGWVYLTSNSAANRTLIYKATVSPLAVEWVLRSTFAGTGDPIFLLWSAGGISRYIGRRTGSALSTSTWHHVFGTYSGGKTAASIKVFVDGVRADTTDLASLPYAGMNDTAGRLHIGAVDGIEAIPGRIAGIRLYNRELTAAEIAQIYNAGAARIALGGTP